ncbi:MAG TPA: hypothetical protein VIJ68_04680, partial [Candidatus Saccharimonadales bacterium]
MASFIQHAFALTAWTQTDWSGGIGASTVNQYSAASNATTSTANQVTLNQGPQLLTNTGFDTDLNGWNAGATPDSIGGLAAWYKADSITGVPNASALSAWSDSSGNNHNLSQGTGANQPLYESTGLNGEPTVRFNGSTNYMTGSMSGFTNAATVFTVQTVKTAVCGGSFEFGVNSGVNSGISLLPWCPGTMYARSSGIGATDLTWSYTAPTTNLITQEINGGSAKTFQAWQDSTLKGTGTTASSFSGTINTATIGALSPGQYMTNIDLSELIAYNTALTTSQRQSVEAYLQNKWGLTSPYQTITRDTGTKHAGTASTKIVASSGNVDFTQSVNVGDANNYELQAYVYTNGSAVSASNAQLYYNGAPVTTTYTSAGGGWYLLSAEVVGANASRAFGVQVVSGQTVYLDDASLTHFSTSGSLTSNIFDTGVASNYGTLSYSATVPANTTAAVMVRAGNQADLSDAPAFTSCSATSSGSAITSACAPNKSRYVQYQIQFTSDGSAAPTFTSISIPYSPSDTTPPPTNASNLAMYRSNGGASIASNGWTNGSPYFTWTAGADDAGGSGILGYCLYLGQDSTGNPITTKGDLGTSPVNTNNACPFAVSGASLDTALSGYIGTALTSSTSPYYLNIKAIDSADNIYNGSPAQFQFRYDNTQPANPSFITAPSEFVSSDQVTLTWPTAGADAASDNTSGVAGLQYRIGSGGTWYGTNHTGSQDAGDLLINNGSYTTQSSPDFANLQQGNNIVYFRTWDNAGNTSQAYVTTVIKINSTAPSSPQNLTATPATNTTNSFGFTWLAPATFTGSASNITYCYSVNSLPTSSNCTYTAGGQTSLDAGAYATEPGDNTLYLAAKDEA